MRTKEKWRCHNTNDSPIAQHTTIYQVGTGRIIMGKASKEYYYYYYWRHREQRINHYCYYQIIIIIIIYCIGDVVNGHCKKKTREKKQ